MTLIDFHHLFRLLPHNYLLLAPDGTILDNSDRHVAVSMLPREQAVGRNIFAAYPSAPQSQQELWASQEYVRTHRQPHTMAVMRYDLRRPEADGGGFEQRYWRITHYPVLDEQGELRYILQHPEDITSQHLAEQALSSAQKRALFTLEAIPMLVWTAQADGTIDYLNQRWRDFTGLGALESVAQAWQQVIHPADLPPLTESWQRAIAAGLAYEAEFRMRRHDGQYRWVLARTVPQVEADGHISMWVGSGLDIHAQKQLVMELTEANEQQMRLAEQAYRTAQLAQTQRETFHSLLQQAPAMIATVRGEQYVYEFVNPPYQQLRPSHQMLGRPVRDVFPEAQEQGFLALLDEVYRTGEPFHGRELPLHYDRLGTGQATEVFFDFTYQAYREEGQIVGITCFAFEVTDRVRMRHQLEQIQRSTHPDHA